MVPLLVPEVFPPVDFSMQAQVFFGDTWHHPYISTCFCGKRFYFPLDRGLPDYSHGVFYTGKMVVGHKHEGDNI